MAQISLCMIVKNEEEMLEGCLASINDLCDEIIIVDTGSTDKTKEIANKFTNQIYDFEWIDDFSAGRNYAFSLATKEFILWLDADDVILEKDVEELKRIKESLNDSIDVVSMFYHIAFDAYGNPTFKFRRNRLVRRENNYTWLGVVHEYLEVSGNIMHADIAVTHRKHTRKKPNSLSTRNINIYEKQIEKGVEMTPRNLFYFANELKDHRFYEKAITYYEKFLNRKAGWIEDIIQAYIYIADCYRRLENSEKEREYLVLSIVHDVPRPEVSCRLGDFYKDKKEHKKAIIWYCLALDIDIDGLLGFQLESYSTWYPHIQLCACYYQIGERELSYAHHLKAKDYRPKDAAVLFNERFFTNNK